MNRLIEWTKNNVHIDFKWYDFWIGGFYDIESKCLYVCLIPMICIRIGNPPQTEEIFHRNYITEMPLIHPMGAKLLAILIKRLGGTVHISREYELDKIDGELYAVPNATNDIYTYRFIERDHKNDKYD